MRPPPRLAMWLLRHLLSPNEPLQGDLLEEYRQGRSTSWYWRQVVIALAAGLCQRIRAGQSTTGFERITIMLKLVLTATVGLTMAFAVVVLIGVPLDDRNEPVARIILKVIAGIVIVWLGTLTLKGLWRRSVFGAVRNRIVVAWGVLLGGVGVWGLLTNIYTLVAYGDIVTGVETGDPEYYLPVAQFALMVQGILTAYYFWTRTRNHHLT